MHRWRLHLLRIDLRPFPLPKSSTAYTAECSHSSPDPTGRAWLCSDTSRPLLRSGKATRPAFRPGVPFLSRGAQPVVACCIKKLQLRTAGRAGLITDEPAARGGFQTTQNLNQPSRIHSPTSRIHSKNIANAAGPLNLNKPQRAHGRAFRLCHSHHSLYPSRSKHQSIKPYTARRGTRRVP